MYREGMTIRDAAEVWVREMNAVPQGMIDALMQHDLDSWHEVTAISTGDRVWVHSESEAGEVIGYNEETEEYTVRLDDDDKEVTVEEDDLELDNDSTLPMWGTMWSFGDSADDYWLEEMDGIRLMSQCGFRIYEHDEFGYFFGIDGCGYSFYEAHWVPLYKARGLHWHDERTEIPDDTVREALLEAGGEESKDLIDKIMNLYRNDSINVGGNYCHISTDLLEAVRSSKKFRVQDHHDRILDQHGYDMHDYYEIIREVM